MEQVLIGLGILGAFFGLLLWSVRRGRVRREAMAALERELETAGPERAREIRRILRRDERSEGD